MGALLEPLGVAINATGRAQVGPGTLTLIFGAGTIGLLCAAMSMVTGASKIVVADIRQERVAFATENGFAHKVITVPFRRGHTIDEKMEIARHTAALATEVSQEAASGFDVVIECTGAEACTQAAIYVSRSWIFIIKALTKPGHSARREGCHSGHGNSPTNSANISSCTA